MRRGRNMRVGTGRIAVFICLAMIMLVKTAGLGDAARDAEAAEPRELQLLLTGDILLSRNVAQEIAWKQASPWQPWLDLFAQADWVVGNLEGAAGRPEECAQPTSPLCFAMPEALLALLADAGFDALSLANNHSADLGAEGLGRTQRLLAQAGLKALTFEHAPAFVTFADAGFDDVGSSDITIGVVALSVIPGVDGQAVTLPDPVARQKLRLARRLAHLVVVLIHWGNELQDWPSADQEAQALWLIAQGADLIIGHHPHVIQAPTCVRGKPVFYSLGNHVFDQKYAATKQGLLADCRIRAGVLRCGALFTRTPDHSAYPALDGRADEFDAALAACPVPLTPPPTAAGYTIRARREDGNPAAVMLHGFRRGELRWRAGPVELLSLDSGRLEADVADEFLFTVERQYSPLDGERSARPYVYQATTRGLLARWRGSALAWPLIDAVLLPHHVGVLCALHRGDSFLLPEPDNQDTRIMAYQWNGFGFSGLAHPEILAECHRILAVNVP
jgi:hypothetical protein